MTSLSRLYLHNNQLTRIEGGIFRNNINLNYIYFLGNRINAIQSTFLNGLNNLNRVDLTGNQCTNTVFALVGDTLQPSINETLQTCFNNFEGRVRRFQMVLEGDLTLTEL